MAAPSKLHLLLDAAYDEHPGSTFSYYVHERRDGSWHILEDANLRWQIGVSEATDGSLVWRRYARERPVWVLAPPPA